MSPMVKYWLKEGITKGHNFHGQMLQSCESFDTSVTQVNKYSNANKHAPNYDILWSFS